MRSLSCQTGTFALRPPVARSVRVVGLGRGCEEPAMGWPVLHIHEDQHAFGRVGCTDSRKNADTPPPGAIDRRPQALWCPARAPYSSIPWLAFRSVPLGRVGRACPTVPVLGSQVRAHKTAGQPTSPQRRGLDSRGSALYRLRLTTRPRGTGRHHPPNRHRPHQNQPPWGLPPCSPREPRPLAAQAPALHSS